jgi:hypothetical protein
MLQHAQRASYATSPARRFASSSSGQRSTVERPATALRGPSHATSLVRGYSTSRSGSDHGPTIDAGDPRYVGAPGAQTSYPQPWYAPFSLPMSWSRPSDVSQVLATDTAARYHGDTGHRWDSRAPEELRNAGGFHARGTGTDFSQHQRGGQYLDESALISFSPSQRGTQQTRNQRWENGAPPGYTYEVQGLHPNHTFDASAFGNRFPAQEEVASARPIGAADVRGVIDHSKRTRIKWPFTPRSGLSDKEFETPWEGDQPELFPMRDE